MIVEIEMGRRGKRGSRIFIDGAEVTRGVLDYDVDLSRSDRATVSLKIWPESLRIKGDLGLVVESDLKRQTLRSEARWILRNGVRSLFRSIRIGLREIQQTWRECHPDNEPDRA